MKGEVLIVSDDERLWVLRRSLLAAGLKVETAPDGFYATLSLERRRPTAILMPSRLSDMTAIELSNILADDPALADVRRVLLLFIGDQGVDPAAGGASRKELAASFDLVIPDGLPEELIAERVVALIGSGSAFSGNGLSGNLGTVDFAQLIQLLGGSREPGVLHLELGHGAPIEARIYFDRGEIVHCAWGDEDGEEAFRTILRMALVEPARFRYQQLPRAGLFKVPKTLNSPAHRLLLTAAAQIDEEDRESASTPGEEGFCA